MKLRQRLALTFTAVTALALVASFVTAAVLVERDELRDLDHTLLHEARTVAQQPTLRDAMTEVTETARTWRRYAALYDARSGALMLATRSFAGAPPAYATLGAAPVGDAGQTVELTVAGARLRGVVVPVGSDRLLLLAVKRQGIDDDLGFLYRVFGALLLGATLVTWLFARWLGGRLSREVAAIGATARAVAAGDLKARVPGSVGTATETKDLAADLDHMIAQLDEAMLSQHTFLSHAAHELRSPLATLRGELQLALRRPRDVAEYREAISNALAEVEQLAALAEDLLTLARVGRAPAGAPRARAGDVLDDALKMARGQANARRVELAPPSGPALDLPLAGARPSLARALRNLVDNAVAHSPEGGRVEVLIDGDARAVRLTVADHGQGVAAEDAPNLFAPFYRAARDQADPGAGLGLAIAREIARAAGGDVTLAPSQGDGARFVLEVPLAQESHNG